MLDFTLPAAARKPRTYVDTILVAGMLYLGTTMADLRDDVSTNTAQHRLNLGPSSGEWQAH